MEIFFYFKAFEFRSTRLESYILKKNFAIAKIFEVE
nr:MAG TPA: hypothetical protein [Caudoviricetes sp.]DAQ38586.1 MAG TPA: hypothetical protein [Caudoviricetes sp.]